MSNAVIRDHLVYPAAALLALSLVTVAQPTSTASAPRLAAVAAIRLQAEVTGYVSALADAALTDPAPPRPAAASVVPVAPTASAAGAPYPSTFFDKLISSLPPEIQSIVLPPLYVIATIVGVIMGIVYTIFGWPKDLLPAASVTPIAPRGPAAAAVEPVRAQPDSHGSSATPGADRTPVPAVAGSAVAEASRADVGVGVGVADANLPPAGGPQHRGRHPAPVAAAVGAAAAVGIAAPSPVAAVTGNESEAVDHPSRVRSRSSADRSADPAPSRTPRRSAQ